MATAEGEARIALDPAFRVGAMSYVLGAVLLVVSLLNFRFFRIRGEST